mgnify:CR=1 FL=1|tara:strand:+ start:200 stop:1909 length:1710 start_codon:yes stop_codon:yes gene_type:complete
MRHQTINGDIIKKIINDVVDDLGFRKKKIIHLNLSFIFDDEFLFFDSKKLKSKEALDHHANNKNKKYDFIFCDLPFQGRLDGAKYISISKMLNDDGVSSFLMPSFSHVFKTQQGRSFNAILKDCGFKILAVIKLPGDFMRPMSGIQSTLVFISKDNQIEETLFADCTNEKMVDYQSKIISFGILGLHDLNIREEILANLTPEEKVLEQKEKNLFDGVYERLSDFDGFEHWEIKKDFKKMESEYLDYKSLKLKDIATIKTTRDVFEDIDNAFYIPAIGLTDIKEKMPELDSKKKPQNFFQVVINDKRAKKKYLVNYFNSEHGQKSIELEFAKYEGSVIGRLRKADVENITIPLPNLGIQDEIIENIWKLHKVKDLLATIESSLSFKPISSSEQLSKLNKIYESSMELSEAEEIFHEIRKGESLIREFKQTFALDIKTKKREDYIVFECVKTIAGFLNAKGGNLYIGVADNSDITGIGVEIGSKKLFKSLDNYLLRIKDTLKSRLGVATLKNIEFIPVKIKGKQILVLNCNESEHQVYIDKKDTYLRCGPSTEKLEGPELVKFSQKYNKNL